jgi:hypothetical protein
VPRSDETRPCEEAPRLCVEARRSKLSLRGDTMKQTQSKLKTKNKTIMIYKHIWQIVLTFLLPFASIAQSIHIDYIKPYGGSQYDEIKNMVLDNAGNIIIAGNSISTDYDCLGRINSPDNYMRLWFSKSDNNFNPLWSKSFEPNDSSIYTNVWGINNNSSSSFFGGQSNTYDSINFIEPFCTPKSYNITISKYDSLGNKIFRKCYGSSDNNYTFQRLSKISKNQNGDIHLFSLAYSYNDYISDFPGTGIPGEHVIWTLTTDSMGNVKYSHSYNHTLAIYGGNITQVFPLQNNQSVILYSWWYDEPNPPYTGHRITRGILINEQGAMVRDFYVAFTEDCVSNLVRQVNNSTFVINTIGKNRSLLEGNGTLQPLKGYLVYQDTSISSPYIAKYIKYWENNLRPEFMNTKLLSSEALYNESDSTYIIYGQMLRGISDVYPYGISSDAFIMKIDTMGNLRYIKYISSNPTLDPNIINDITVTSCLSNLIKLPNENSYIGQIVPEPNGVNGGNLGRFIGDYSGLCNRGYDCSHNGTAGEPLIIRFSEWPTGINNVATPAPKAQLFPNPAQDILLVHTAMQSATQKLIQFNILDVSSKILFSQKIESEHNHTIPISTLQPGFYLLQISYSDNGIHKQVSYKFIKQK